MGRFCSKWNLYSELQCTENWAVETWTLNHKAVFGFCGLSLTWALSSAASSSPDFQPLATWTGALGPFTPSLPFLLFYTLIQKAIFGLCPLSWTRPFTSTASSSPDFGALATSFRAMGPFTPFLPSWARMFHLRWFSRRKYYFISNYQLKSKICPDRSAIGSLILINRISKGPGSNQGNAKNCNHANQLVQIFLSQCQFRASNADFSIVYIFIG